MARSIEAKEADRLARERLERVEAFVARVRPLLDRRPVSREEWDAACDDPLIAARR